MTVPVSSILNSFLLYLLGEELLQARREKESPVLRIRSIYDRLRVFFQRLRLQLL